MELPSKPWVLSVADHKWLKSVRISPHDICPTCRGERCRDCHDLGVLMVRWKTDDTDREC